MTERLERLEVVGKKEAQSPQSAKGNKANAVLSLYLHALFSGLDADEKSLEELIQPREPPAGDCLARATSLQGAIPRWGSLHLFHQLRSGAAVDGGGLLGKLQALVYCDSLACKNNRQQQQWLEWHSVPKAELASCKYGR